MQRFVTAFPIWVTLGSVAALLYPPWCTWFSGPWITYGLGGIMLGMGLTLTWPDLSRVWVTPRPILAGVALQYTVMPALGFGLGHAFGLPDPLAAGLVLVACCPGGTASNVIAYLARADVALSVSMTAVSTLLAVVCTPWLTAWLLDNRVAADPWALLQSTAQVVLLPVGAGLLLRHRAPRVTHALLPVAPAAAVVLIVMIVASIIGSQRDVILASGLQLIAAIMSLHAGGFLLGHVAARRLGLDEEKARTIAIEVGMQNSGLGVVLARQHFSAAAVAVPPAISSVVHCVIGSLLAAIWSRRPGARSRTADGIASEVVR